MKRQRRPCVYMATYMATGSNMETWFITTMRPGSPSRRPLQSLSPSSIFQGQTILVKSQTTPTTKPRIMREGSG